MSPSPVPRSPSSGAPAPLRPRLRPTGALALVAGVSALSAVVAWAGAEVVALVTGAGLTCLALAPLLARAHLTRLRVSGPAELTAIAGSSQPLALELENRGWFTARDLLMAVLEGRRASAPPTAHVPALAPGRRVQVRPLPRFVERGRSDRVTVVLETGFPFGLFVARATLELPLDLCVLPRLGRLSPREARAAMGGALDESPRGRRGQGEFYALHEWRPGEPLHGVAWKPSARRGRLLSRELTCEDRPAVELVLSTWVRPHAAGSRRHAPFERAVSLAATLVDHFLRRGQRVTLTLAGPERRTLPTARGRADLLPLLVVLAEVEPHEGDPARGLAGVGQRGDTTLVVLAGGGAPPPALRRGVELLDVDQDSGLEAFESPLDPRPLTELATGGLA